MKPFKALLIAVSTCVGWSQAYALSYPCYDNSGDCGRQDEVPPEPPPVIHNTLVPVEANADKLIAGFDDVDRNLNKLITLVHYNGYRCDSISAARPGIFHHGYELVCNNFTYTYWIEDKGGQWAVTVE
jgi:hypothetical protein